MDFKGWQRQKYTANTVQQHIESALSKLLKEDVTLKGAGRTDAGVSAYNQVANFNFAGKIEKVRFIYSVNSLLPRTITVKNVVRVPLNFHSRFSATRRDYIYKVTTKRISIGRQYYYKISFDPDFKSIDSFFTFLKKQTNFRSLCKNSEDKNGFCCRIFELKYQRIKSKNEIHFTISSNRFLHSMVRAIIGCALDIGRGKTDIKTITEKIKSGEKIPLHYLPANALFLNKIHYKK